LDSIIANLKFAWWRLYSEKQISTSKTVKLSFELMNIAPLDSLIDFRNYFQRKKYKTK
jgi:hypothetical protein